MTHPNTTPKTSDKAAPQPQSGLTPKTPAYGKLYLVPAPLDFGCDTLVPITDVLPQKTMRRAAQLQHWISENSKSTRAVLKRIGEHSPLVCTLQEMQIQEMPREMHKKGDHLKGDQLKGDHAKGANAAPQNAPHPAAQLLQPALQGHDIGLMSEAGMPAVADPGSSIVRTAHDLGIAVEVLVGPVSLLLALAASGLGGQQFAFHGYLAQDSAARKVRISALEKLALQHGQSQIFIETPYRNQALLSDLLSCLQPHTRLSVSQGLTLDSAQTRSASVKVWRDLESKQAFFTQKLPAIFSFG